MHISSLATPFPILFLISDWGIFYCTFKRRNYFCVWRWNHLLQNPSSFHKFFYLDYKQMMLWFYYIFYIKSIQIRAWVSLCCLTWSTITVNILNRVHSTLSFLCRLSTVLTLRNHCKELSPGQINTKVKVILAQPYVTTLYSMKGRTQNLLFYGCNHVYRHLLEERGRITHWSLQYFARAFEGMESSPVWNY